MVTYLGRTSTLRSYGIVDRSIKLLQLSEITRSTSDCIPLYIQRQLSITKQDRPLDSYSAIYPGYRPVDYFLYTL